MFIFPLPLVILRFVRPGYPGGVPQIILPSCGLTGEMQNFGMVPEYRTLSTEKCALDSLTIRREGEIGSMTVQVSKKLLESSAALEACRARLHRFLMRRLKRRIDTRDLLQEVYMRFLQTPDHDLIREPMAYLYRVAANLAHDVELRERQSLVTFDSEAAEEASEATADIWKDDVADPLSAEQSLEKLLGHLPAIYQAVLLLRKRDGLSCEQIAHELGISKHTAEKYLYRAIAQVRMAHRSE